MKRIVPLDFDPVNGAGENDRIAAFPLLCLRRRNTRPSLTKITRVRDAINMQCGKEKRKCVHAFA
ncbi:MAG: hypothetical protein IJI71_16465 [Clostridia bacterium]|nr:hypothetical protein [Clostridia bacterium]